MEPAYSNLDQIISQLSLTAILIAVIFLTLLSVVSIAAKNTHSTLKKVLFIGFVTVTVACTLFLAGSTIYLNVVSSSGGPVHYHADYEVWKCGEELELEDPKGLSNKIGTSTIHEHNDKRIHIEGVLVSPKDASLGNYFQAVGGSFDDNMLSFLSHHGHITLKNGENCPDYPSAQLQVFLYKVEGEFYSQAKIKEPQNYIISPASTVPPGDCIIVELDWPKKKTDKLCQSFDTAIQTGDISEFKN